jgi:hypothetical protein
MSCKNKFIQFFVKNSIAWCLIALLVLFISSDVAAQCPMCRITAESNLKDGGTMGRGLNNGILYMFFTPYLIVGAIGIWWWRNNRKEEGEMEENSLNSQENDELVEV